MRKPYSPETLAAYWGCSARHIRRMCRDGELPSFKLGGRLLRIRADDVERYECQNGGSPAYEESSASHGRMETFEGDTASIHPIRPRRTAAPRLDTRN